MVCLADFNKNNLSNKFIAHLQTNLPKNNVKYTPSSYLQKHTMVFIQNMLDAGKIIL